jgi:hypothetical protein
VQSNTRDSFLDGKAEFPAYSEGEYLNKPASAECRLTVQSIAEVGLTVGMTGPATSGSL